VDGWELLRHGYLVCFVWVSGGGGLTGVFAGILAILAWGGMESVVSPSASLRPSAEWNAAFAAGFRREAEA